MRLGDEDPDNIELSVVVPAYNEERRLGPTLYRVAEYLSASGRSCEIIVVSDGSSDGTVVLAQKLARTIPFLRVVEHSANLGKGHAVRTGMLLAKGKRILFSDADLSVPIEEVETLWRWLDDGFAIAIGSRGLPDSRILRRQAWYRQTMGKAFNVIVRFLTGTLIRDTQCGFKLFSREAVQAVFDRQEINGFGFDVEVLLIAQKAGLLIKEVPVSWIDSPDSRVHILRDSLVMLWELFSIWGRSLRSRYRKRS